MTDYSSDLPNGTLHVVRAAEYNGRFLLCVGFVPSDGTAERYRAFFADRWKPNAVWPGEEEADFGYTPGTESSLVTILTSYAMGLPVAPWMRLLLRVTKFLGLTAVPTDASFGTLLKQAEEWARTEEVAA